MAERVRLAGLRAWATDVGVKRRVPDPIRLAVRRALDAETIERRRRPALWGNLRRHGGFSPPYAEGRGTPVDRHYVEVFLDRHRRLITGRVLEVHDTGYTDRFGHDVSKADAVDIRTDNPQATIVADLCEVGSLPPAAFDCAVITQTIHLVPDMAAAMANLHRSLRPGGTLLLTGPVVSPSADDLPTDAWRFTRLGLRHLAEGCAEPDDEIEVVGYGNRISAVAFLLGLALEDLGPTDLDPNDPHCELIVALRLRRA